MSDFTVNKNPISEWLFWRRFWRSFNWSANYALQLDRMDVLRRLDAPPSMITSEAHMILEAHYRGRWRVVWGVFKKAASDHYLERYWPFWEWFRTRVLRRSPDETFAEAERDWEEEESIEELMRQL